VSSPVIPLTFYNLPVDPEDTRSALSRAPSLIPAARAGMPRPLQGEQAQFEHISPAKTPSTNNISGPVNDMSCTEETRTHSPAHGHGHFNAWIDDLIWRISEVERRETLVIEREMMLTGKYKELQAALQRAEDLEFHLRQHTLGMILIYHLASQARCVAKRLFPLRLHAQIESFSSTLRPSLIESK
jgi:hypothetical protein